MSKSLVAFDTDRIKDYVFGTGKLKEIRGASALLDRLNRVDMPELVGGKKVYANGGAGLFFVDSSRTEPAVASVQAAYRRGTKSASITGATVELSGDELEDVGPEEMDLLRRRLRWAKDNGAGTDALLTHPLLQFCDSCGEGYAELEDEGGEVLCGSCALKRKENLQVQGEIEAWTSGQVPPDRQRLWGRLIGDLREKGYPIEGYGRPNDFGALGRLSSPRGYMALIYADGDGMSREVDKIDTLEGLEAFSRSVDETIYLATAEAIAHHLQPASGQKTWPFDVLLLGGDDLVMVTRAQSGLDVALSVVERFPKLTDELLGRPLNLSASVVITHINYPIGSLIELASHGLKFAKERAALRALKGTPVSGGLINFLAVSSSNYVTFDGLFEDHFEQKLKDLEPGETGILRRTQRPYGAAKMKALLDQVRGLRGANVPRTKLEQLRQAVHKSRRQAMLDAMKVTLRIRNKKQREALLDLAGPEASDRLHFPWIRQGDDWVTPVLDVVEVFDFVR